MFLKVPKFWYSRLSANSVLQRCLKPVSSVYRFFALRNLRKNYKYKAQYTRVIAVGGFTVGGSGKTPVVASICSLFKDAGRRAAILSRGFGRDSGKVLRVDLSWHNFKMVGDEPLMLARHTDVFVSKDRMEGAKKAEGMGYDLVIMDDGLMQRDLKPDISIVVVDSSQRFGNGELLPLGPNRIDFGMLGEIGKVTAENSADSFAVAGARESRGIDAVVIIKSSDDLEDTAQILAKIPEGIPVFTGYLKEDFSQIKTRDISHFGEQKPGKMLDQRRSLKKKRKKVVVREAVSVVREGSREGSSGGNNPAEVGAAPQASFLAFCGIGYPQKFFNSLRKKLKVICEVEFPDHYPYSDEDIVDLLDEARILGANLVTTEKDLCRISKQYHNFISVVPVEVVWENPAELSRFFGLDSRNQIIDEEIDQAKQAADGRADFIGGTDPAQPNLSHPIAMVNTEEKIKRPIKLLMASDHAGFKLKSYLKSEIQKQIGFENVEVVDLGTDSEESCDYPLYAYELVQTMDTKMQQQLQGPEDMSSDLIRGVLICGTGIGMSIAANRHPKIRAALCNSEGLAVMARRHNDANVLVLGARFIDADEIALNCLKRFLETEFEGGRHERRVRMLDRVF